MVGSDAEYIQRIVIKLSIDYVYLFDVNSLVACRRFNMVERASVILNLSRTLNRGAHDVAADNCFIRSESPL